MSRASQNTTHDAAPTGSPSVDAPLAPYGAFVVHLREGTPVTAGALYGRVEHVASGAATSFRSLEEVRAFMDRVLADHERRAELPREDLALDHRTDGST